MYCIGIMDIRRLEAFSKVYELGSFSKAGEELFLSQPTISAHVSSLEDELGVRLFDRLGRTIVPTKAGDILYRHACEAFKSLENAQAEIGLLQNSVGGELVVGASTIPGHYFLPQVISGFLNQHPAVKAILRIEDSAEIVRLVASGEVGLGVVGAEYASTGLTYEKLFTDDLVAIGPAGRRCGGWDDCKQVIAMPWVVREKGSGTRETTLRALEQGGYQPHTFHTAITVCSTHAVLECVRLGLGVSITSRMAAKSYLERGELVELDLPGVALQRSMFLVYHEKMHRFPVNRFFFDHIRAVALEIESRKSA